MDETLFHVINNISATGKSATDRFRIFCKYYSILYYDMDGKYIEEERFLIDLVKESFPEWLEWIRLFPNLIGPKAGVMGRQTFNSIYLEKLASKESIDLGTARRYVGLWINRLVEKKERGVEINFLLPIFNPRIQSNLGIVKYCGGIYPSLWLINLMAPKKDAAGNHSYVDIAKNFIP